MRWQLAVGSFSVKETMWTPRVITTVEELSQTLGDDFVLFVGSAVSGCSEPKLAMVGEVIDGIIDLLPSKLENSYIDQLYANYAQSLLREGAHRNLTQSTKFEEFLWFILRAAHRGALDDLLAALYSCAPDEFGPNHKAIAALLKSGRCKACFTTNFDNAIELACQSLGLNLITYSTPGRYPAELPGTSDPPILIKLHGDASIKNCVAESTLLLSAQSENTHGHLERLLAGKRVFVLGYSGLGDIDISPHLSKSQATFVWANHCNPRRRELPDWANYFIQSNLDHSARNINALVALSGIDIRSNERFPRHLASSLILRDWIARTQLDVKKLLHFMFEWRRPSPLLHIRYEEMRERPDLERVKRYGWACNQRRAYQTALKVFETAPKELEATFQTRIETKFGAAFALWRLGRLDQARTCLRSLIAEIGELSPAEIENIEQELPDLISDVHRIYLEVSRDLLQLVPPIERVEFARLWDLNDVRSKLKHDLSTRDRSIGSPQNMILGQVIERNLGWLLGEPVSRTEIQSLGHLCLNSNYPTVAWAVVALLWQVSLVDGLKFYSILNEQLKRAGINHYLRKVQTSVITGLGFKVLRLFGISGFRGAKWLIHHLSMIEVKRSEQQHAQDVAEWEQFRLSWNPRRISHRCGSHL